MSYTYIAHIYHISYMCAIYSVKRDAKQWQWHCCQQEHCSGRTMEMLVKVLMPLVITVLVEETSLIRYFGAVGDHNGRRILVDQIC